MSDLAVYVALFAMAFVAATILPMQSEAGLAALVVGGAQPVAMLVTAASLGNTLGSVLNWFLGRSIGRFSRRRWFPASPAQMERATNWYRRYGRWSLALSWIPIIGDPLTVVAGVLREPLWSFVTVVALAKTMRYLIVAGIALSLI